MTSAEEREFLLGAVRSMVCEGYVPQGESDVAYVASFLSVVDGEATVTGGDLIGHGSYWMPGPNDGIPRLVDNHSGQGEPSPKRIAVLATEILQPAVKRRPV